MNIHFTKDFRKSYKKRIQPYPKLLKRFRERIRLFKKDRFDPILKNHPLKGSKAKYSAISITGDIRALYTIEGDEVYFADIGTHNQVY